MATPSHTTPKVRPSRRTLLSAGGAFTALSAAAVAGFARPELPAAAAPPSPSPDARLLGLVAAFLDNERRYEDLHSPWYETPYRDIPKWVDAESHPLVDRSHRLRRLIGLIPARTRAGMEAKARAAMAHACIPDDEDLDEESDAFIAHSVCRDLLRGVAA